MIGSPTRRALSLLEGALWLSAFVCGATLLTSSWRGHRTAQAAALVDKQPTAVRTEDNPVVARLDISSIALSVPILKNYDPTSLRQGVGHIPGTAEPGGLGNLVLVGHRDTYFRSLRSVKPGMEARVGTPKGTFHYRIDSTEIVTPERVSVLDFHERPEMTLITCYPFDYIGTAPKRFVVHAHLLSLLPERPLP